MGRASGATSIIAGDAHGRPRPPPRPHPQRCSTASADPGAASSDAIEHTLTDGYARALALEARAAAHSSGGWASSRAPSSARAGSASSARSPSGCAASRDCELRGAARPARRRSRRARRRRAPRVAPCLDDPAPDGVDRRLDAVLDLQLHQDVRDVVLDRLRADEERPARSRRCPCRSRSASAPRARGRRARRGSSRAAARRRVCARRRWSTFAAICGEMSDSPAAAARMPAISSWIDESLSR